MKLVFSQPYPKREFSQRSLDALSRALQIVAEFHECLAVVEDDTHQDISNFRLSTLADLDYVGFKGSLTNEQANELFAKLHDQIPLSSNSDFDDELSSTTLSDVISRGNFA